MSVLRRFGFVLFFLGCGLPLAASVVSSLNTHVHKLPPTRAVTLSIPPECLDIATEMTGKPMKPEQFAAKLDEFTLCRNLYAESK